MKIIRFEQIGRNCFDTFRIKSFPNFKMEIWPGFDIRLTTREAGVFLNIEPCHKIVRYETALEFMTDLRDTCDSRGLDFRREIEKELRFKTVITKYNKKAYLISGIAFDKTPKSKFTLNDGKEISFQDYYQSKYKEVIADCN